MQFVRQERVKMRYQHLMENMNVAQVLKSMYQQIKIVLVSVKDLMQNYLKEQKK